MKCHECGTKFSAADYQPAPGGTSAPGEFLILGATFIAIAVILWLSDLSRFWAAVAAAVSVLSILKIPFALFGCRGDGGNADHKGVSCPECKSVNKIRPWSL
jgi:hypothetical protein